MPLSHVKVHIPSQSLEVICDNIEADEWKPILKAISSERNLRIISITHKNLFHVTYFKGTNLQSNVHRIQQGPVNSTSSNIVTLTKALLMHIQFSRTLSCLQLQGIRLKEAAVDNLCKGVETNDSLQKLVLKECPLTNIGCQKICEAIQNCRTIKSLELQNCNITHCGALSLAEAIKSQEVYREEIWVKNSVDRTSGKNHAMGIERINLSGNQTLGDKGLQYILLALFGNDGVKG
ncbi:hypothetical protein AAG570_005780 [Ranatra chinensis]|uniref:Uncharacterized protein n=1 Tax=Ranatra chinensis TaxID=642074 RepID=A0ABD0YM31_9HEMI